MAAQFWTRAFLAAVIIAMIIMAGLAYLQPDGFAAHIFPGIAHLSKAHAPL